MINERFEKCVGCNYFNPDLIEEHCSHDPETWNADTCYDSFTHKGERMSFPDVDEIEEKTKYPDRIYLDSEWMEDIHQVYVLAEGLNIEFHRPGHNLEIIVSTKTLDEPTFSEHCSECGGLLAEDGSGTYHCPNCGMIV